MPPTVDSSTTHSPALGATAHAATTARPDAALPAAARRVLALLARLQTGTLTLIGPDGVEHVYGTHAGPHAWLMLHDWGVCAQVLKSGDIGFAEAYRDGHWTTPDLAALLRLLIANRRQLEDAVYGHWIGRLAYRIRHLLNRNTRHNSRKNIHAHYDLGNAFYELWLDGTMNYSSAWFEGEHHRDLAQAQTAKVRRALRMAGVQPGDRVLEIGCGWGAVAEAATTEFGARLTGVTLSTEQLAFARARMNWHGSAQRADLRLQDYRDIDDGPYDAIVSIEMIEAVGQAFWPTYFETVARLLKPGGRACIQSITIDDALFKRYLQSTDFIQQYIFPGGCLPSRAEFRRQAQAAGLQVVDELAFGPDYAETLRRWRESFTQELPQVRTLGFDEPFVRLWTFYLAYCEAAFDEGNIDVMQFTLARPA
jgi:cyclopropane-fatty-acyl-phospholipid synthase